MAKYNEFGEEIPDDTPVEMPLNFTRPLSIQEEIQRSIRTELSRQAVEQGEESFEEADDFDVLDEPELVSQYELLPMQEEHLLVGEDRGSLYPRKPARVEESKDGEPAAESVEVGVEDIGSVPRSGDRRRSSVEREESGSSSKASVGEARRRVKKPAV